MKQYITKEEFWEVNKDVEDLDDIILYKEVNDDNAIVEVIGHISNENLKKVSR